MGGKPWIGCLKIFILLNLRRVKWLLPDLEAVNCGVSKNTLLGDLALGSTGILTAGGKINIYSVVGANYLNYGF